MNKLQSWLPTILTVITLSVQTGVMIARVSDNEEDIKTNRESIKDHSDIDYHVGVIGLVDDRVDRLEKHIDDKFDLLNQRLDSMERRYEK